MPRLDTEESNRLRRRFPYPVNYMLAEDDEQNTKRADAERWQRVQPLSRAIPNFDRYFESKLHDSAILAMELVEDRLILTLNDLSVCDLACMCASELYAPAKQSETGVPVFPVRLVFHEISDCRVFDQSEGQLRRRLNLRQTMKSAETYLYDSFAEIGPARILAGLVFWGRRTRTCRLPVRLLQVDCARLTIVEQQRDPFLDWLGPRSAPLFDYFMLAGRPWDVTQPESWRGFYDGYCSTLGEA